MSSTVPKLSLFSRLRKIQTTTRPQDGAKLSNGPAESAAEPQRTALAPRPVTIQVQQPSWHPKLTGYRALVLIISAGLGVSKIILTYLKTPTASVTLEWIFTVILGLAVSWLGLYEEDNAQVIPWLFERDYSWDLISILRISVPHYTTDERAIQNPASRQTSRPPLTGYHLLVNFFVASFGLSKAILAYRGSTTAPDVLDWVFAVLVSIGLYYLGLYEKSSTGMWPAMFKRDYGLVCSKAFLHNLAESKFFPYTLGLALASAASCGMLVLAGMIQPFKSSADHDLVKLWFLRVILLLGFCIMGLFALGSVILVSDLFQKTITYRESRRWRSIEALKKAVFRPFCHFQRASASVIIILPAALYIFAHFWGLVALSAVIYVCYIMATFPHRYQIKDVTWLSLAFLYSFTSMAALIYAVMWLLVLWSLIRPVFHGAGKLLHHVCDSHTEYIVGG